MNLGALLAVVVFAGVLLTIFGLLYRGAARSQARGELNAEGLRVLRWALLGHVTIYVLLAISALLT